MMMDDFVMMDERKLLKKAVELGRMRPSGMTPEVVQVALGWLRGEVRLSDAKRVLGCNNTAGGYQRIALALREAWQEGLIAEASLPSSLEDVLCSDEFCEALEAEEMKCDR